MDRSLVDVSGIENFRGIGGYTTLEGKKVKPNMLYRSAKLDTLTEDGSKLLDGLGIRTIVDFRDAAEVANHPTKYPNASIVHIPIVNGDVKQHLNEFIEGKADKNDASKLMQRLYAEFVTECGEQYARFFNLLLNPAYYPILFHCTAGKDRTGFAAATLMALLGVDQSAIVDSYLATNGRLTSYKTDERIAQLPERLQEVIAVLMSADKRLIESSFNAIKQHYGSVENYFGKGLGINSEQQAQLKLLLLE